MGKRDDGKDIIMFVQLLSYLERCDNTKRRKNDFSIGLRQSQGFFFTFL